MFAFAAVLFALLTQPASAGFMPPQETFFSPASLKNFKEWYPSSTKFGTNGTETAAFYSFMNAIYAADSGYHELELFFPETTERLRELRKHLCPENIAPKLCALPDEIKELREVVRYKTALLDSATQERLMARWNFSILRWEMPLHEPVFSLLVGPEDKPETHIAKMWEMPATELNWRVLRYPHVWDVHNTRTGMSSTPELANTIHGVLDTGNLLHDWVLRDRAMEFAHNWKHAVDKRTPGKQPNPIYESQERQMFAAYDELKPEFERVYQQLLPLVAADSKPEYLERFQTDHAMSLYPEEVYQHVAYAGFRDLAILQGNYFSLVAQHRTETSERQQALEVLLSLQRYSKHWRFFVFEISNLMEPVSSHARVINQTGNGMLANTYVFEHLRAVLGMGEYEGKALFPAIGKGLISPELFTKEFTSEHAPDIHEMLAGRDFTSLSTAEQTAVIRKYIQPTPGKFRPMSLYRVGILLFSTLTQEELQKLADGIHETHGKNFR